MEREEYKAKVNEVMKLIENSKFFKKFGYPYRWLSGSSTYVYPISHWVDDKEIVIQLDSCVYRGRTQSAKALISEIDKILPIKNWGYGTYDGSRPPQLYIIFW